MTDLNTSANGVLFLCVANSSRSQMAEGFARVLAPTNCEVFSAGSSPTHVHPLAVRVMGEVGTNISGQRSKSINEIEHDRIGTVITLCAEQVCPVLPGQVTRHHWPFEDPAAATRSQEASLAAFRRVRDGIGEAVARHFRGLAGP